jgi:hypothetical protein
MAKASDRRQTKQPTSADTLASEQYTYRGRSIEINPASQLKRSAGHGLVVIDSVEVPYHKTVDGVHSHEFFAFRDFGNVYELAEALVRQWGDTIPDQSDHAHH